MTGTAFVRASSCACRLAWRDTDWRAEIGAIPKLVPDVQHWELEPSAVIW